MKNRFIQQLILVLLPALILAGCGRRDVHRLTETITHNFTSLKAAPRFIALAPGAVTPQGWIEDWAKDAAKGITGHLDEYSPTFEKAWKGFAFEAKGATANGGGWPLEQCSYWLDGAVRLGFIMDDSALIKKTSARLDTVVNGVLRGGETFIYWMPKKELINNEFNSWAHSHMGRALVAYYEASGDEKVLKALNKVYRNFSLPALKEDFANAPSGSVNIEPMTDTYLLTGDTLIKKNILAFGETTKYSTLSANWNAGKLTPGHNVVYYEDIRVPSVLYSFTGKKSDLDATLSALEYGENLNMLPVGVISGEEYHAGIGSTRNIETCDVAAAINTFGWLLQITGEDKYSDKIEKIFFNAASPPVARDFSTMCYYQSMNRFSSKMPAEYPYHPGFGANPYLFTNLGHPVLCCVGNNCRIIPYYIQHMWMATPDNGIAATLYGPCKLTTEAGGVKTEVISKTVYPFGESIHMIVNPEKPAEFPVYLHIPGWCTKPSVKVNGEMQKTDKQAEGFIKLLRIWNKNDSIRLDFPMSVKVEQGYETPYPQIDYFDRYHKMAKDTTIHNPYSVVSLGPLVFSLPIPDIDPNQEVRGTEFGYALDVSPENASRSITVERKEMPGHWSWQLDAPVVLTADARAFNWKPAENKIMPEKPIREGNPARIKLVPYGTTKFRVTMFPVTAESFNK